MGLELGQVITQIIGFLIAVILLKKFAWKPLLSMLEERRSRIKAEFDGIDEQKRINQKLLADYEAKLKEIDALARVKIQEGAREGEKMAGEIKETARREAREIVAKTKEDIQRDLEKAKVQLRDDVVQMTLSLTEKLIGEKLDEERDKKLISRLADELEQGEVEGMR
ncbi:MAG: F0F1 ATP synthase subunit B [Candidatus Zixiibacteriota bacterium]